MLVRASISCSAICTEFMAAIFAVNQMRSRERLRNLFSNTILLATSCLQPLSKYAQRKVSEVLS